MSATARCPASPAARWSVSQASRRAGSRPLPIVSQHTPRGHTSRVPGGADEGLRPLDPQRSRAEARRIAGDGFRRDGQSWLRRPTQDGHGRVCGRGSGGGAVLRRAETGAETQGVIGGRSAPLPGRSVQHCVGWLRTSNGREPAPFGGQIRALNRHCRPTMQTAQSAMRPTVLRSDWPERVLVHPPLKWSTDLPHRNAANRKSAALGPPSPTDLLDILLGSYPSNS